MNREGRNRKMSPSKKCGVYKLRIMLKGVKNRRELKKSYAVIFREYCPSHMQNIIKEHLEYDSILNDPLKLMDAIYQSIHKPIRSTYPYLPLT